MKPHIQDTTVHALRLAKSKQKGQIHAQAWAVGGMSIHRAMYNQARMVVGSEERDSSFQLWDRRIQEVIERRKREGK